MLPFYTQPAEIISCVRLVKINKLIVAAVVLCYAVELLGWCMREKLSGAWNDVEPSYQPVSPLNGRASLLRKIW